MAAVQCTSFCKPFGTRRLFSPSSFALSVSCTSYPTFKASSSLPNISISRYSILHSLHFSLVGDYSCGCPNAWFRSNRVVPAVIAEESADGATVSATDAFNLTYLEAGS